LRVGFDNGSVGFGDVSRIFVVRPADAGTVASGASCDVSEVLLSPLLSGTEAGSSPLPPQAASESESAKTSAKMMNFFIAIASPKNLLSPEALRRECVPASATGGMLIML
jgi:hypothetical protein